MTKNINALKTTLFTAQDGGIACDAINALAKHASKGSVEAQEVLAFYTSEGRIQHMRTHACSCLAESLKEPQGKFVGLFQKILHDPELRYWSILGFIRTAGMGAYQELIRIAEDQSIPLDQRGHAIKCLAVYSKQPFDRHLPSDPGHWKENDLRLAEVKAWANDGYPDGKGYSLPNRHSALDKPRTDFEKVVSRLDKKLAKKRSKDQDLANPTFWLALAAPEDLARIKAKWTLPAIYLDFLTRFSPVAVTIANRKYYNHFQLFGAGELIDAQDGYSFNSVEQQPLEDWPAHLVVIASHGGDPFVLDLANTDGKDAPVDTAEHGMGEWVFSRVADSFHEFLETLAK